MGHNESLDFGDILPIRGCDLRSMRSVAGLTTLQMAKAAGVKTRKTYENWEKDVGTPNVNQFFEMVKACDFDLDSYALFTAFQDQRTKARSAQIRSNTKKSGNRAEH